MSLRQKMSDLDEFDIGIVGTSLFSAFLAGLLAQKHSKRIALFLDISVQHQISREINVSFDCQTRPKTWHMLQNGVREALPVLNKIGGGSAIAKTNALLICQSEYTSDALSHLYHFLHGEEFEIERLSKNEFKNCLTAYRLSGLKLIRPGVLWPAILDWLNVIGVPVFNPQGMSVKIQKDGFARINTPGRSVGLTSLVLADEQAILSYGSERAIDQLFIRNSRIGVLSQPVVGFNEHLVINPESNFCARQKLDSTIEILADGTSNKINAYINDNILSNALVQQNIIRLSGRSVFSTLKTKDGAAIVGKMARTGVWGCAGLGMGRIFFAPAIARFICGKPSNQEQDYFAARSGDGRRKSNVLWDGCTPMDNPR